MGDGSHNPERTPRIRAMLAMSLDGYIADESGGFEWLNEYDDAAIDFESFSKSIAIRIVGRTTFDQTREHLGADEGPLVVLTHRPIDDAPPFVRTFDGDPRELVAQLRDELAGTGKDVWHMGGGASLLPFHEAELIDRWEISVIPILLGKGIPMFPRRKSGHLKLRLAAHMAFSNGIVSLEYEPLQAES